MRRRVTFSRNFTLSLSRTCRCYCKYCSFATHRAHLYAPDDVLALLDHAARRNVKELLVLTGERPEVNAEVAARLESYGHPDFTSYVVWACQRALERGLLPHTNLGVLESSDLERLREVTASQGLMLESANPGLAVHQGSPTKHPEARLATIEAAGELKIPFTSGVLVGIGESERDRVAALERPGGGALATLGGVCDLGRLGGVVAGVRDEVLEDHLLDVPVLARELGDRVERGEALRLCLADPDEDPGRERDPQLSS